LLNNDRILACYTKKEFPGPGEQLAKPIGPIGPWTGPYRAKNAQVLGHKSLDFGQKMKVA